MAMDLREKLPERSLTFSLTQYDFDKAVIEALLELQNNIADVENRLAVLEKQMDDLHKLEAK